MIGKNEGFGIFNGQDKGLHHSCIVPFWRKLPVILEIPACLPKTSWPLISHECKSWDLPGHRPCAQVNCEFSISKEQGNPLSKRNISSQSTVIQMLVEVAWLSPRKPLPLECVPKWDLPTIQTTKPANMPNDSTWLCQKKLHLTKSPALQCLHDHWVEG